VIFAVIFTVAVLTGATVAVPGPDVVPLLHFTVMVAVVTFLLAISCAQFCFVVPFEVKVATPLVIPGVPVQPEIVDFDDTLWVTLTVGLTGGVKVAVPVIFVHVNTGAAAFAGPAATNPTGSNIATANNTPPTLRILKCSPLRSSNTRYTTASMRSARRISDRTPCNFATNVIVQARKREHLRTETRTQPDKPALIGDNAMARVLDRRSRSWVVDVAAQFLYDCELRRMS